MYTNLVISGGGVRGVAFIGCIKALEDFDQLRHMNSFIGSSVGSIIALMLTCGYSSNEMLEFVNEIILDDNLMKIDLKNMFKLLSTYGIDDGNNLMKLIENILLNKNIDENINFVDIVKRTGKNIIITGSNLSKQKYEYFSVDTTPNMLVKEAIRISSTFPIVFTPYILNDEYYVDAGLYNNFPITYFKRNVHTTLGIELRVSQPIDNSTTDEKQLSNKKEGIKSFYMYLMKMIYSVLEKMVDLQSDYNEFVKNKKIVSIIVPNTSLVSLKEMRFNLDSDKIKTFYEIGKESMIAYLNNIKSKTY